jgi:NAD+ synthase
MLELPRINAALLADALAGFLREELRVTSLGGYVVGLSGGLDSAVSAALAVAAVGRHSVRALALPGPTSDPRSLADAEAVAQRLELPLEVVSLGDAAITLAEALTVGDDRLRFGNLIARLRMIALFDRARTVPGLVLGTSNKSEILLGYSTLFGDSASSVNPLGDLWKTQIYDLGRHLELPDSVLEKPPTADLWPGQTDASELGFDYLAADPVLYWHHEQGLGRDEIVAAGAAAELVDAVLLAYRRNRFKWRPTVVARVSASAVNVDRILPRNPER